jgi:histidine triad (HIT) family protein
MLPLGETPLAGDCLFCRIANGELPAHEVFRDAQLVAFMDIGPIRPGHLQIMPVAHYETFDELPPELASGVMRLGQRLAKVQKALFNVERVAFLFTGGDVAHAHAHLVPLVEKTDITSRRYIEEPKLTFRALPHPGNGALEEIAAKLAAGLAEERGNSSSNTFNA